MVLLESIDLGWVLDDPKYIVGRFDSFTNVWTILHGLTSLRRSKHDGENRRENVFRIYRELTGRLIIAVLNYEAAKVEASSKDQIHSELTQTEGNASLDVPNDS